MKYITVKPTDFPAGIGHQFCNWLVPNILARRYNLKFVHQPFVGETDGRNNAQGSNGYQISNPVKLWNDFLNLGNGQLTLKDLPKELIEVNIPHTEEGEVGWDHQNFKCLWETNLAHILYKTSELGSGQFINIDWDFYKNNDLKTRYNNSKQVKNFKCYFDKDDTNIAITIRRGDVTKGQRLGRWIDLDYYLHIMNALADIKELKHIIFHIYAWDMPEEEKNILLLHQLFGKREIKLHIDEDVFSTFYHFTKADIFVSGQGSFSLLANYLTDATKLTTPWRGTFNNNQLMHWDNFPNDIEDIISINSTGAFDSQKVLKALKIKNEKRNKNLYI